MGDAAKTIDCVKVAYANAPRNARVRSVIVTAHQQSFGKVMFSQVSVWHSLGGEGGPHVTITHGTLYLAVQAPHPPQAWNLNVQGLPSPSLLTSGGHHWRRVQTCSLQNPQWC